MMPPLTPMQSRKRYPDIHKQVDVWATMEVSSWERLLYEWTKTGQISLTQFRQLLTLFCYVCEMGEHWPDTAVVT